jgi:hypothetical protein
MPAGFLVRKAVLYDIAAGQGIRVFISLFPVRSCSIINPEWRNSYESAFFKINH